MGTPLFGATFMASAALASVTSQTSGTLATASSEEPTVELPAIQELRTDAADAAARSTDRSGTTTDSAEPTDPAEPPDSAEPTDPVEPTASPRPTLVVTPSAPAMAFAAVPGCDATVPADGSVDNGDLGDEHLCAIGENHRLRPDAAAAFVALAATYREQTGESLEECVTDSYRSYDAQVDVKERKPYLAARPGTSNHGWGLAVDLACGADSYGSDIHDWLDDNAGAFGWENPGWAQADGSKPEPWHWEYDSDLLG